VLLASEENSPAATGSIINCDGGMGVRGFAKPAAAPTCESLCVGSRISGGLAVEDLPKALQCGML
jgi:hypothetical protein